MDLIIITDIIVFIVNFVVFPYGIIAASILIARSLSSKNKYHFIFEIKRRARFRNASKAYNRGDIYNK